MAPNGHWNDPNFLHDLVVAFYEAGTEANAMNAEIRKDVAARMRARKHEVTWEGIRQHIQKLRRTQDSPEKTAKTGSVPVTPTKATPKRKTRAPKTKPAEFDDADDEITVKEEQYYDDDQGEPETKRVKKDAE